MSNPQKFRITLWAINTTAGSTGGWRGDQKAVVFDAKNIGIEEFANDSGSAYWTLPNDHPQLAEFVPLERHYEISRWSNNRSRWEFVAAGILDDYTATEEETVFSGLDYKSVLNQHFTTLTNITLTSTTPIAQIQSSTYSSIFDYSDTGNVGEIFFGNAGDARSTDPLGGVKDRPHGNAYFWAVGNPVTRMFNRGGETAIDHVNSATDVNKDGDRVYNVQFTDFSYTIIGLETVTAKKIDNSIVSVSSPGVRFTFSAINQNSSTDYTDRWDSPVEFRFRINASPPAAALGNPPVATGSGVAEFSMGANTGSGNIEKWRLTDREYTLYPVETRDALIAAGAATSSLALYDAGSKDVRTPLRGFTLRRGVTYKFAMYCAVFRRGDRDPSTEPNFRFPKWLIDSVYKTTEEFTIGQRTDNVSAIISSTLTDVLKDTRSRLRYATLSVSGSTYTTHKTYTAGQPVLDYIGDVCDLEMGARTDGGKAIFGILKPSNGSTYSGNFQLRLNVSSAALSGIALRYPENIKRYSFAPGYSRVRNDVTIIPTSKYLSGSTGEGVSGVSIVGATASDSASINLFGRIPLIATKDGFINEQAAKNEAARLITLYGKLDAGNKPKNTKNISLRVVADNIELWDGWDVGDSIGVVIEHGNVSVNEPFVISGVRWMGESNGAELIEFELVQGSSFAASFAGAAPTRMRGRIDPSIDTNISRNV